MAAFVPQEELTEPSCRQRFKKKGGRRREANKKKREGVQSRGVYSFAKKGGCRPAAIGPLRNRQRDSRPQGTESLGGQGQRRGARKDQEPLQRKGGEGNRRLKG